MLFLFEEMKIIDTKMNASLDSWYIFWSNIYLSTYPNSIQSIYSIEQRMYLKQDFLLIHILCYIKAILFSIPNKSTTFERRSKERIRFEGLKKLSFYFCNLISVCSLTQSVKSAKKFSPKIWVAFWNIWDYFCAKLFLFCLPVFEALKKLEVL